jgi:glycosyltransferase involved in cell wall biosynthesis
MFGRGVYGGFGRATRIIGRELAKRNIEVTAVVPQRQRGAEREYQLNGMRIIEFAKSSILWTLSLYRAVDADIYHSQEASLGTYMAMRAMPERKHIVTFRDPMDRTARRIEWRYAGPDRLGWLKYRLYTDNFLVSRAVRRADALFCAANFLIPKVQAKFVLQKPPLLLPTPVDVPDKVAKAAVPTVCFIARWHRRKRPEAFFELAKDFPDVKFIAVGGTHERKYEEFLRRKYSGIANLEMTGTIDQFETDRLSQILSRSWILINTAAREGLPTTFLEAAANRCAILSWVDPDGFASQFGYHAADGNLHQGLRFLLEDNRWARCGERGFEYVRSIFASEVAMKAHVDRYREILDEQPLPFETST